MKTFTFNASSTEGSIEKVGNWDDTPADVSDAIKLARAKHIDSLFPMPEEWDNERRRTEIQAAFQKAWTVEVKNKTTKFIGSAVVEFGEVTITINI